jgi:hypothetical protein
MTKNMGVADRALRILLGLVMLSLVFVGPHTPWGWLGVVLVGTATVGWCPLYSLVGLKT